jgi:hypothetical protein
LAIRIFWKSAIAVSLSFSGEVVAAGWRGVKRMLRSGIAGRPVKGASVLLMSRRVLANG